VDVSRVVRRRNRRGLAFIGTDLGYAFRPSRSRYRCWDHSDHTRGYMDSAALIQPWRARLRYASADNAALAAAHRQLTPQPDEQACCMCCGVQIGRWSVLLLPGRRRDVLDGLTLVLEAFTREHMAVVL